MPYEFLIRQKAPDIIASFDRTRCEKRIFPERPHSFSDLDRDQNWYRKALALIEDVPSTHILETINYIVRDQNFVAFMLNNEHLNLMRKQMTQIQIERLEKSIDDLCDSLVTKYGVTVYLAQMYIWYFEGRL